MIYEQPTPCMRGPDVLTIEVMTARYAEAHIMFESQCPHLAQAPDLVFREMDTSAAWGATPPKLTAIARATDAYLELIRGTSKSYRRAVRDDDANWIAKNHDHWQMRARWLPAIGAWVRYTTSVATKPRRKVGRPYPVAGVDLELELEPILRDQITKPLMRRGVVALKVSPGSMAIQAGDAVVIGSDGFVHRAADVGDVVSYSVEVVGPGTQPGTVLVQLNI